MTVGHNLLTSGISFTTCPNYQGGMYVLSGSVAAGLAGGFVHYATRQGACEQTLYAASGLSANSFQDQDSRVSMQAYESLILKAIELTKDGALPLRFGVCSDLQAMSIVGLVMHTSTSVADSFKQLARYSKLMVEVDVMDGGDRFSFEPEARGLWIIDNRPNPNRFPALTEMAFARLIGEFRKHFPERQFGLEMHVTHPAPSHAADYEKILQLPVIFNSHRNAMRIDPGWLEVEIDKSSRYVFGMFTERADALVSSLEQTTSLRGQIEAYLLPILHSGDVSISKVAEKFAVNRNTLHRRLRKEGVTFAEILDDLRHRMAIDYLCARKVSVNQTAYLVGFTDPSSFIRAFRRWRNMTPTQYLRGKGAVISPAQPR